MRNTCYIFLMLVLSVVVGCKDPAEKIFSPVPEIELISVNPTQVVSFRDSIVFEVEYTDGDGDLGSMTEDNFFIEDDRIQVTHGFRVQEIVPDFYGQGQDADFHWKVDINTGTLPSNAITYMRYRVEDGSHTETFEFPTADQGIGWQFYMSFFVVQ